MKYVFPFMVTLSLFAFPATAQTSAAGNPPQSQDQNKAQDENKDVAADTSSEKQSEMKKPKTRKDLDAFFKEGERQAKDGPRCDAPPVPTV